MHLPVAAIRGDAPSTLKFSNLTFVDWTGTSEGSLRG